MVDNNECGSQGLCSLGIFILMEEGGNKQTHNLIYDVQQERTSTVGETRQVKSWLLIEGWGVIEIRQQITLSKEMTFKLNAE